MPSNPPIPKAADPVHGQVFDPYNSSSTGHQRAENRLGASTGWRDSRNRKLMSQYTGGAGGGDRVSDTVGEGSQSWDPRARALVTPEARARARSSVMDMLANPGIMKSYSSSSSSSTRGFEQSSSSHVTMGEDHDEATETSEQQHQQQQQQQTRKIFDGVVVYVNGSTHPLISDHRLKHVLAEHGGKMSSHLGRRSVTHVILGRPAGKGYGSGGGLAGGKLQKEIAKVGGAGVKYVGVQWVLDSIKAGRRLPEARFADLKIAAKGQRSVYGLYSSNASASASASAVKSLGERTGMPGGGVEREVDEETLPPPSGQR